MGRAFAPGPRYACLHVNPFWAGATDVTVAVQVPAATAAVRASNAWAFGVWFPLLGMLVAPFGLAGRRLRSRRVLFAALLLLLLASTGAWLGCGGSSHPPATPTSYTITVTVAWGSVSHSSALTLTVQ